MFRGLVQSHLLRALGRHRAIWKHLQLLQSLSHIIGHSFLQGHMASQEGSLCTRSILRRFHPADNMATRIMHLLSACLASVAGAKATVCNASVNGCLYLLPGGI